MERDASGRSAPSDAESLAFLLSQLGALANGVGGEEEEEETESSSPRNGDAGALSQLLQMLSATAARSAAPAASYMRSSVNGGLAASDKNRSEISAAGFSSSRGAVSATSRNGVAAISNKTQENNNVSNDADEEDVERLRQELRAKQAQLQELRAAASALNIVLDEKASSNNNVDFSASNEEEGEEETGGLERGGRGRGGVEEAEEEEEVDPAQQAEMLALLTQLQDAMAKSAELQAESQRLTSIRDGLELSLAEARQQEAQDEDDIRAATTTAAGAAATATTSNQRGGVRNGNNDDVNEDDDEEAEALEGAALVDFLRSEMETIARQAHGLQTGDLSVFGPGAENADPATLVADLEKRMEMLSRMEKMMEMQAALQQAAAAAAAANESNNENNDGGGYSPATGADVAAVRALPEALPSSTTTIQKSKSTSSSSSSEDAAESVLLQERMRELHALEQRAEMLRAKREELKSKLEEAQRLEQMQQQQQEQQQQRVSSSSSSIKDSSSSSASNITQRSRAAIKKVDFASLSPAEQISVVRSRLALMAACMDSEGFDEMVAYSITTIGGKEAAEDEVLAANADAFEAGPPAFINAAGITAILRTAVRAAALDAATLLQSTSSSSTSLKDLLNSTSFTEGFRKHTVSRLLEQIPVAASMVAGVGASFASSSAVNPAAASNDGAIEVDLELDEDDDEDENQVMESKNTSMTTAATASTAGARSSGAQLHQSIVDMSMASTATARNIATAPKATTKTTISTSSSTSKTTNNKTLPAASSKQQSGATKASSSSELSSTLKNKTTAAVATTIIPPTNKMSTFDRLAKPRMRREPFNATTAASQQQGGEQNGNTNNNNNADKNKPTFRFWPRPVSRNTLMPKKTMELPPAPDVLGTLHNQHQQQTGGSGGGGEDEGNILYELSYREGDDNDGEGGDDEATESVESSYELSGSYQDEAAAAIAEGIQRGKAAAAAMMTSMENNGIALAMGEISSVAAAAWAAANSNNNNSHVNTRSRPAATTPKFSTTANGLGSSRRPHTIDTAGPAATAAATYYSQFAVEEAMTSPQHNKQHQTPSAFSGSFTARSATSASASASAPVVTSRPNGAGATSRPSSPSRFAEAAALPNSGSPTIRQKQGWNMPSYTSVNALPPLRVFDATMASAKRTADTVEFLKTTFPFLTTAPLPPTTAASLNHNNSNNNNKANASTFRSRSASSPFASSVSSAGGGGGGASTGRKSPSSPTSSSSRVFDARQLLGTGGIINGGYGGHTEQVGDANASGQLTNTLGRTRTTNNKNTSSAASVTGSVRSRSFSRGGGGGGSVAGGNTNANTGLPFNRSHSPTKTKKQMGRLTMIHATMVQVPTQVLGPVWAKIAGNVPERGRGRYRIMRFTKVPPPPASYWFTASEAHTYGPDGPPKNPILDVMKDLTTEVATQLANAVNPPTGMQNLISRMPPQGLIPRSPALRTIDGFFDRQEAAANANANASASSNNFNSVRNMMNSSTFGGSSRVATPLASTATKSSFIPTSSYISSSSSLSSSFVPTMSSVATVSMSNAAAPPIAPSSSSYSTSRFAYDGASATTTAATTTTTTTTTTATSSSSNLNVSTGSWKSATATKLVTTPAPAPAISATAMSRKNSSGLHAEGSPVRPSLHHIVSHDADDEDDHHVSSSSSLKRTLKRAPSLKEMEDASITQVVSAISKARDRIATASSAANSSTAVTDGFFAPSGLVPSTTVVITYGDSDDDEEVAQTRRSSTLRPASLQLTHVPSHSDMSASHMSAPHPTSIRHYTSASGGDAFVVDEDAVRAAQVAAVISAARDRIASASFRVNNRVPASTLTKDSYLNPAVTIEAEEQDNNNDITGDIVLVEDEGNYDDEEEDEEEEEENNDLTASRIRAQVALASLEAAGTADGIRPTTSRKVANPNVDEFYSYVRSKPTTTSTATTSGGNKHIGSRLMSPVGEQAARSALANAGLGADIVLSCPGENVDAALEALRAQAARFETRSRMRNAGFEPNDDTASENYYGEQEQQQVQDQDGDEEDSKCEDEAEQAAAAELLNSYVAAPTNQPYDYSEEVIVQQQQHSTKQSNAIWGQRGAVPRVWASSSSSSSFIPPAVVQQYENEGEYNEDEEEDYVNDGGASSVTTDLDHVDVESILRAAEKETADARRADEEYEETHPDNDTDSHDGASTAEADAALAAGIMRAADNEVARMTRNLGTSTTSSSLRQQQQQQAIAEGRDESESGSPIPPTVTAARAALNASLNSSYVSVLADAEKQVSEQRRMVAELVDVIPSLSASKQQQQQQQQQSFATQRTPIDNDEDEDEYDDDDEEEEEQQSFTQERQEAGSISSWTYAESETNAGDSLNTHNQNNNNGGSGVLDRDAAAAAATRRATSQRRRVRRWALDMKQRRAFALAVALRTLDSWGSSVPGSPGAGNPHSLRVNEAEELVMAVGAALTGLAPGILALAAEREAENTRVQMEDEDNNNNGEYTTSASLKLSTRSSGGALADPLSVLKRKRVVVAGARLHGAQAFAYSVWTTARASLHSAVLCYVGSDARSPATQKWLLRDIRTSLADWAAVANAALTSSSTSSSSSSSSSSAPAAPSSSFAARTSTKAPATTSTTNSSSSSPRARGTTTQSSGAGAVVSSSSSSTATASFASRLVAANIYRSKPKANTSSISSNAAAVTSSSSSSSNAGIRAPRTFAMQSDGTWAAVLMDAESSVDDENDDDDDDYQQADGSNGYGYGDQRYQYQDDEDDAEEEQEAGGRVSSAAQTRHAGFGADMLFHSSNLPMNHHNGGRSTTTSTNKNKNIALRVPEPPAGVSGDFLDQNAMLNAYLLQAASRSLPTRRG